MKKIFFSLLLIGCLFYTSQAQILQPTAYSALVSVTITDFRGNPTTGGDIVLFKSSSNGKIYSDTTASNGTVKILLPKHRFTVSIKGFQVDEQMEELEIPTQKGKINMPYIIRYELPTSYILENVSFTGKGVQPTPESNKALNDVVDLMKRKKSMIIQICSHTDSEGDENGNMVLTQRRADAVKQYLVLQGIEPERITAVGYGESKPIASNSTDEGRQTNRRTEVIVLHQ